MATQSLDYGQRHFIELFSRDFYQYGGTVFQIKVIRADDKFSKDKRYLGLHKWSNYLDPVDNSPKQKHNFVNYPVERLDNLIEAITAARAFLLNQGVIYLHAYCLLP